MKSLALAIAGLSFSAGALAATGHALPYRFDADTGNLASVQRGARNYMNYCASCHSMKHLRYGRMGRDLGIPEDLLKAHLMFTSDKVGDPIKAAMPPESAKWFGLEPPDLTVETRMRGADWVYNYLMTFYVDPSRPTGVNNLVLPGASMPHVLWELQGWQVKEEPTAHPAQGEAEGGHGAAGHGAGPRFKLVQPGKLTEAEYKKFVADTVNFMAYAAEPGKAHRVAVGAGVMLFLLILTPLVWLTKKEWWSDVH